DTAIDQGSLDARLIDDHAGRTSDRTLVTQLLGEQSSQAFSDSDGGTAAPSSNSADWTPGPAGGIPSGVDHESIAAGRYSTYAALPPGAGVLYPHAVYYCSQTIVSGAFCSRSDDGGATYGTGVSPLDSNCVSLHGKPRVGPDGVVYLPDQ